MTDNTLSIWKLTQNTRRGYDTYDSCIVVAATEDEARQIPPESYNPWGSAWAYSPAEVQVEYLGEFKGKLKVKGDGTTQQVLLASFNAG